MLYHSLYWCVFYRRTTARIAMIKSQLVQSNIDLKCKHVINYTSITHDTLLYYCICHVDVTLTPASVYFHIRNVETSYMCNLDHKHFINMTVTTSHIQKIKYSLPASDAMKSCIWCYILDDDFLYKPSPFQEPAYNWAMCSFVWTHDLKFLRIS